MSGVDNACDGIIDLALGVDKAPSLFWREHLGIVPAPREPASRSFIPMRFRVSQELRQPVGTEFTLELRERSLLLDDDAVTDVQGDASLLRTDRGLLVTLRAAARLKGACSRCLAPLELPIEIDFQEEFIPLVDPVSGTHIASDEAEDSFVIDADLMLDLGEALRQYALMSMPGKPLCRPDCAGLCPTCGANLNEGPCACQAQDEGRWRALAALKTKDEEGS